MYSNFRKLGRFIGLAVLAGAALAADPVRELRVCADPNNLPFSNEKLEGFENKIAQAVAMELNASVSYTWLSQRGGFLRKTLMAGKCDLIMSVPTGYELVLSTKPYYSSYYVFVSAKGKHLRLRTFDDPVLRDVRIGIHAFGEAGASPAAIALGRRGIVSRVVGFTILDTAESPPGKIIHAVAAGEIDVAIVWGPFAGYFAKREPIELEVVPVSSSPDLLALPLNFDISMGVRPSDQAFKDELDDVLNRRCDEIRKVLEDYAVPLANPELRQEAVTTQR